MLLSHLKQARFCLLALLFAPLFIISCKKEVTAGKQENSEDALSQIIPPLGNNWISLGSPNPTGPPTANMYHVSFTVNNKVYVGLEGYNQLWEYDPATTTWTKKQNTFYTFSNYDFPNTDVFTNGNSVYFLNPETKNLREYNVLTNVWTNKANFPGNAKRIGASANTNTKGYIMAGTNGTHNGGLPVTISENWEYDFAGDSWLQKANTPGFGRNYAAAYAIDDKIYFGTGYSIIPYINPVTFKGEWKPIINNDWHEFNTLTNTWTQKASFAGGTRTDTRGFVIGGKVYLGMGTHGYFTDIKTDLWAYNPATNSWVQRVSYPPGNSYPPYITFTSTNSRGYAITGMIDAFWKYTPPIVVISPTPTL
jgi:hypothetical protein